MIKKYLIAVFAFSMIYSAAYSQQQLKAEFHINHLNDSLLYLGSYYGNKSVVADTAYIINQTTVVFNSKDPLPGGIYFLVNSKKEKLFEFVIDKDQKFKIETDTGSFAKNANITGSEENQLFFDYVQFTNRLHDSVTIIRSMLQEENISPDRSEALKKSLRDINNEVSAYKENLQQQHPDHILSLVFNVIKQPEIPDSVKAKKNPMMEYMYFRDHYWDQVNFTDERLLRIPGFYDKLHTWFTKVIPQHPDSIITAIDQMMMKAEGNTDIYNYLAWYFIEQYDQEKIMGFDKIFVHIAETYFRNNDLITTTESVKQKITERAEKLEGILIGQPAPNLILMDTNNRFRSFMDISSEFVILLFWDQDCGVCKEEIKVLKQNLDTTSLDIEVFAVCTDTNLSAWKNKISKYEISDWVHVNGTRSITADYHDLYDVYGTPLLFVLNRKKEIIAKKIAAEQIIPYLYQIKKRK